MALSRAWSPLVLALSIVGAACGPGAAQAPAGRMVSLRFEGGPEKAWVFVDDVFLGPLAVVGARGVAVPAGVHTVTVKEEGYFPDDRVLDLRETPGPVTIAVTLKKLPE